MIFKIQQNNFQWWTLDPVIVSKIRKRLMEIATSTIIIRGDLSVFRKIFCILIRVVVTQMYACIITHRILYPS